MAKKTPRPTFDVAGLKELSGKLLAHREKLAQFIRGLPAIPTFDEAVKVRDAAQILTTTCLTIDTIGNNLMELAEYRGSTDVPHLDDCCLDWHPDEND